MNVKKIIFAAVGVLILAVIGYFANNYYEQQQAAERAARRANVSTVERRDLAVLVQATGTIAPAQYVDVAPKKTGRITSILVKENDRVTKGQLVATLDSEDLETKKEKAEIEVRDKAAKYNRMQYLYSIGAKSAEELETALFNYDTAKTTLATAQADINDTLIYASMDGTVVGEPQTVGAMATQGTNNPTVIMRIADLSKKEIMAKVDESDIGAIKVGQDAEFTVDAYPGEVFRAKVKKISQSDTSTSWNIKSSTSSSSSTSASVIYYYVTLDVEDNENKLFPAMTARVDIVKDKRINALTIPITAVKADKDGAYVMVRTSDGKTEKRPIKTGITVEDYVEILEGLEEGEKVVSSYTALSVDKSSGDPMNNAKVKRKEK
jgi:HlyD family secretion protein/macrolide-specific efflux system membrane fusion protein